MEGEQPVVVLRLGHRPGRDDRMTTHVGLTARALGADRVIFTESTSEAAATVDEITHRFGGPFATDREEAWRPLIDEWPGQVVHLTMYGRPVQAVESALRQAHQTAPLLIVVGAGKVPFEVYDRADWNVAVTNQPHSEVAALAVLLDRLFEGRELDRPWQDAEKRIVPRGNGKEVESVSDGG